MVTRTGTPYTTEDLKSQFSKHNMSDGSNI